MHALTLAAAQDEVIFAADGHGGFVVPKQPDHRRHRGLRQAARPGRPDQADAEPDRRQNPDRASAQRSIPTPWAAKGGVMRTVMEAAGQHEIDTTDGVRVTDRVIALGPGAARPG